MYLLKVTKKEYIDDLVKNGNLYLTLASSFRDTSRYGFDKVDIREGLISMYDQLFICPYGKLIPIDKRNLIVSNGNECIFSFKWIAKNKKCNYIYNSTTKEMKLIIGEYQFFHGLLGEDDVDNYSILIIKDTNKFLERVKQTIEKLGLVGVLGTVSYDDHYFQTNHSLFSKEYMYESYFHKDNDIRYIVQNEYRILVDNNVHEDLVINIGKDFFKPNTFEVRQFNNKDVSVFSY